jgi:hypothetical protein
MQPISTSPVKASPADSAAVNKAIAMKEKNISPSISVNRLFQRAVSNACHVIVTLFSAYRFPVAL